MYITEKKALEDIMEYMKTVHNFAPSKRAFQTQFKRWGFPSKQNPAHKNVNLVARVKDLWEKNTSQRDMLNTLNAEGFEIKERELMRVRAKNRWLLRVPNGMKAHGYTEALIDQPPSTEDSELMASLHNEVYAPEEGMVEAEQPHHQLQAVRAVSPPLAPEVIQKRKERLERLQAESEARYAARKRRRRTRGWAGLPADPPAPPRFPSETTIDESKTYLDLDNERYRQVRDDFQTICEEVGIIKKTTAGNDAWQAAKGQLIRDSPHLSQVFSGEITPQYNKEQKSLALDVICTDVTKRMRTLERRMTIAEAKNALGINPEQSRQIRNAFYNTLKADHFTSKLEAGEEHWKELKELWIQSSPLLQLILAGGEADPEYSTKVKAMEVLCRDVMKRLRDDQTKRDPNRRSSAPEDSPSATTTAMPPPARKPPAAPKPASTRTARTSRRAPAASVQQQSDISTLASKALARTPVLDSTISDFQIDPSLLAAASTSNDTGPSPLSSYLPATDPIFSTPQTHQAPPIPSPPVPVYLRLSPTTAQSNPRAHTSASKLHLATLSTRTISALHTIITSKFPASAGTAIRIDGVASGDAMGAGGGDEVMWRIDTDDELDAYLSMVLGDGGKAVFVVGFG